MFGSTTVDGCVICVQIMSHEDTRDKAAFLSNFFFQIIPNFLGGDLALPTSRMLVVCK